MTTSGAPAATTPGPVPDPAEGGTVAATRQVLTSVVRRDWGGVFGMVSPAAVRRRPSDVARVLVAAVFVFGSALAATNVSATEQAVYELISSLPDAFDWLFEFFYGVGAAVGVLLIVGAAVVARRPRLGLSMVLAGGLAFAAAVALTAVVDVPGSLTSAQVAIGRNLPDFPAVRLSVTTAFLLAASPHLTRPARRLAHALIVLTAVATVYLVDGLPVGAVAAMVLGWGVAALVHLLLGSPAGVPSTGQVQSSLRAVGVEVTDLRLREKQIWGQTAFEATGADGAPLQVWVIGRDAADAHLFAKLWRALWYRGSGVAVPLTRAQQIEHQAFLLFVATQSGARVPAVVAVGLAGRRADALLVVRDPAGRPLSEVDPSVVTDDAVTDAWRNLQALHAGRIAHGGLGPASLELVDGDRIAFADLATASTAVDEQALLTDRVALLALTAALVGSERALDAAEAALGRDGLVALLPVIEPAAVSRATLKLFDDPKKRVAELRDQAAARAGVEVPQLIPLRRITWAQAGMAVATIFGVYLLVGQLATVDFQAVVTDAQWDWVALTFLIAQTPQFAMAVAMLGTVQNPLPMRPVVVLQYANNFTGLIGGSMANAALNIRFFQKQGMGPAVAVSSGVLNSVGSVVSQAVLVVIGLAFTSATFTPASMGGDSTAGTDDGGGLSLVGVIVIAVVVAVVVVLVLPGLRHKVWQQVKPQLSTGLANLREIAKNPRKAAEIFGGNFAAQVLYALVLQAALHAYGASLPLPTLIVINSFASVFAGVMPVPGGMGVMEAGLIGGMTAAGIDQSVAVAATFTARLCTAYLPPIWGWFAFRWLGRNEYI